MISEDQYRRRAFTARRLADSVVDTELGRTLRAYAVECDLAADAVLALRKPAGR